MGRKEGKKGRKEGREKEEGKRKKKGGGAQVASAHKKRKEPVSVSNRKELPAC